VKDLKSVLGEEEKEGRLVFRGWDMSQMDDGLPQTPGISLRGL
jgi:hypothetical protein